MLGRFALQKHKDSRERKGVCDSVTALLFRLFDFSHTELRPLVFGFSMLVGAAIFLLWTDSPSLAMSFVALVVASLGALLAYRANLPALVFLFTLFGMGASLGHCIVALRTALVAAPQISAPMNPAMVEGWLKAVEPGQNGARLRIKVHAIAGLSPEATPVFVRVTHANQLEVFPGRFVRCWSVLRPPPAPEIDGDYDFQRQAYFEQLGAVGYVQGKCSGGALGAPGGRFKRLWLSLDAKRRQLAVYVNQAAGLRAGGFAAALVSGDRSFMRLDDQEALRGSGLAHLLAISGLHLGLVGGLAYFIGRHVLALIEPLALRVPVQKLAAVLGIASGALYLVMSGSSVSTQRAFIMLAVVLGAVIFDRVALSMRSFAIALILVVAMQPESVLTPGFQMSFAATGALIATYEAWTARRRQTASPMKGVRLVIASIGVTSTIAGAATAPFAFYHFSRVASMGLLANFAAMPIISFVSAPLAVLSLILAPVGLGDMGLRLFGASLEGVLAIAHYFADQSPRTGPALKAMPGFTLALLSLGMLLAVIGRGWQRGVFAALCVVPALLMWWFTSPLVVHWSSSGAVFTKSPDGEWSQTRFVAADGLPPLRFSEVEAEIACEGVDLCVLKTVAGNVILAPHLTYCPSEEDYALILSERASVRCPNVYLWQQVREAGGLSFRRNGGDWRIEQPDPCGRRAWRTCPPQS